MPTDVEILMEMGFPQNRAEKALSKTNYRGAQPAMDWLLEHQDDADIDVPFEAPKGYTLGASAGSGEASKEGEKMETAEGQEAAPTDAPVQQAASLKCDDCGKLLKTELDAQAHAARTQHSNFSESTDEIKPLTEEEKKQQLEKVQERLALRRKEKEEEEKKQKIERERIRRKQGQELTSIKQQMEEKEMKRLAEAKRREKEEERLARQKVKEDIEKDKRERATKFAKQSSSPAAAAPAAAAAQPAAPVEKKTYDDCRLQIRLTNGQAITQTFKAKEQLAAVRLYVELHRTDGPTPFVLMTSFPRKVFTEEDMEKPLTELGLVPSAVLIVTKK